MSRRKQAKPQHIGTERNPLTAIENGAAEGSHPPIDAMNGDNGDEVIGDVHVCGNCRGEFVVITDFVKHKQNCTKKQVVVILNEEGHTPMDESSRDPDEEKDQDTASDRSTPSGRKSVEPNYVSEGKVQQPADQARRSSDPSPNSGLPPSNVSLDNLENTTYAVAQFRREAAAGLTVHPDMVMIQEQLYALQQQHLHQLHMIQSIQQQINHLSAQQQRQQMQQQQHQHHSQQHPKQEQKEASSGPMQSPESPVTSSTPPTTSPAANTPVTSSTSSAPVAPPVPPPPPPSGLIQPPHMLSPAGAAAASAIQQSAIEAMQAQGRSLPPMPPPFPIPGQRSPFEMLQQHATMHVPHNPLGIPPPLPYPGGLLAAAHRKGKPPNVSVFDPKFSADDPFFRHKCRFCHKVFGSDSALQIHIRSHTGERPYKCNICGNRFSTKGNLKVHFQRHQSRYPHIQMDTTQHPPTPPLMDQPLQPPSIHQVPIPTIPNETAKLPTEGTNTPQPPSASSTPGDSDLSLGEIPRRFPDEDQYEPMQHSSDPDKLKMEESESPLTSRADSLSPNATKSDSPTSASIALSSNVFPVFSAGGYPVTSGGYPMTSGGYPMPHFPHGFPRFPMEGDFGMYPHESSAAVHSNDHLKPPTPPSLANLAEAGMRTSETSKLQQLVENIEQKITDPNQCVICHRVLSCKSSLQLHYRIHTGERPYKCKVCSRSFTTKGNLKTHYAVHRSKPPVRMLHDCPICEKRFSNPLVLQQHLRLHAAEGVTIPQKLSSSRPAESNDNHSISESRERSKTPEDNHMDVDERNDLPTPEEGEVPEGSVDDGDKPEDGTVPSEVNSPSAESQDMEQKAMEEDHEPSKRRNGEYIPSVLGLQPVSTMSNGDTPIIPSPVQSAEGQSMLSEDENRNIDMSMHHGSGPASTSSSMAGEELEAGPLQIDENNIDVNGALDLRPKGSSQENIPPYSDETDMMKLPSYVSREGMFPEDIKPAISSAGLLMTDPAGMVLAGQRRIMRTNTTCHFCGKVFACASALNIHYRSHTKERPFRCDVCSKGFSTKGNLKQHMLTHKIRDMPMPRFETNLPSGMIRAPIQMPTPISQELPLQQQKSSNSPVLAQKRSLTGSPEENAKRTQLRHSCSVCGKQFQTNSALEIHMRTHTGEKPFRCHICSRAFTTKGNLKVHLGTHMWNGGGRRGRRIAVEPPLIISPKEGEVFRSDLFGMHPGFAEGAFFPYPPPHLMNGFAAAAATKANEISVIQPPTSLHLPETSSVIMRTSVAPSVTVESRDAHAGKDVQLSRSAPLSRESDPSREISLSRDEALNREIALSREEALSREITLSREEALSREIALSREEALSREMALSREETLNREIVLSREESLSREIALNREMALNRELAQNKEIALERPKERLPVVESQMS